MRIAIGSDHAGYQLKRLIADHLSKQNIECCDYGAPNGVDPASYVPYGQAVAQDVTTGAADFGIVICGTGLGISMTARESALPCAPTNTWPGWLASTIMPTSWPWGPA